MNTFATVLNRADITCPDQTIADIEVPVTSGPQRQGDILVIPRPRAGQAERTQMTPIPPAGVAVVRGEATGNTHLLMADANTRCLWQPRLTDGDVCLGVLHVPTGGVAWLIHTDEHGANGIGAGTYTIHGKREQADEIRRVAD